MNRAVLLIKVLHGLLSAFFIACITYVYYAGITRSTSPFVFIAVAALLLEGTIVLLNRGDCPLGAVHRRLGDEKRFFELFLPGRAAAVAVPFFAAVTAVGLLILLIR